MSKQAICLALIFFASATPSLAQDCGSTNPSAPCTTNRITTVVDGITFTWSVTCNGGACQAGRFLDGSPWVRNSAGGDVEIVAISPDDAGDGLEKNPGTGTQAVTRQQGLLACAENEAPYNSTLDLSNRLPFRAPADNGVYVKAKRFTGGDCGYTSAVGTCCVDTYTALTVLNQLPPDGVLGSKTFRPGAAGATKLFVTTNDLDLSTLPKLSQVAAGSYSSTVARWGSPYPDFFTGINGDQGRRWAPHARGLQDYAAERAERNLIDTFGVFSNDAMSGAKLSATYALAQYGMELYSGYMQGIEWTGGAGQNQGRWHPIVFFGALSKNETVKQNIRRATANVRTNSDGENLQFTDLYQVRPNVNGVPIWGSAPGADGCTQGGFGGHGRYWADYSRRAVRNLTDKGKGTCGDPYGYIDGPAESPGDHYAGCCSSGLYVSMGLIMKIWGQFKDVANNPVMQAFAERIMNGAGWWTAGDQCAIADPREPETCSPYSEDDAQSTCNYFGKTWGYKTGGLCVTISEARTAGHPSATARWPGDHLKGRPSLDRQFPGATYWDLLSGVSGSPTTKPAPPILGPVQ
jgi:hypothetical protein